MGLVSAAAIVPSLLITMVNNCGFGTTTLINASSNATENAADAILATGNNPYSLPGQGLLNSFLDDGHCFQGGGNCSTVTIDYQNGTVDTTLDVTAPHAFSEPFGFSYVGGGCSGGLWCSAPDCINISTSSANCTSSAQVGLVIRFCLAGLQHQIPISASLSVSLPSSTSSHSSSSHPPPPAAVVLGVLGGLLGLAAVALLVLFVRRRRTARPKQEQDKIEFRARTPHTQDPDVPPDPHRPPSPSGSSVAHQAPMTVVY